MNYKLVDQSDCERHRPIHGKIFAFEVTLLKFDVDLQKIFTIPQFSKYDRRPLSFKI